MSFFTVLLLVFHLRVVFVALYFARALPRSIEVELPCMFGAHGRV
jgi:hypothetical protein